MPRWMIGPVVIAAGCTCSTGEPTIDTGVSGTVTRIAGNQMPGALPRACASTPLEVELRAYPVLSEGDLDALPAENGAYGRYQGVPDNPAASAHSDTNGFYELALPPGRFTILARDGDVWFCNRSGREGMCVIRVDPSRVTNFDISIDYEAAY